MKKIKVADLKAGMRFDKPLYVEGESLVVPAEMPVQQKDIERLIRWEVQEIRTEGSEIKAPPKALSEQLRQVKAWFPVREGQYSNFYYTAVQRMERFFQDLAAGISVSHDPIDAVVTQLAGMLRKGKNQLIQLVLNEEWEGRKLSASAVNCAIVAAVIGTRLRFTNHRLLQLAAGALLHDAGMLRVSKEIVYKEGRLAQEERNRVKTHPLTGYRVLAKELKFPEQVAIMALQHHERWDGKGYPRSLRGEEIALSARIVTVADAYEAMVGERPYRSPLIGYAAMKNILSDNGKHFDPQVLKAFLESMGVFPIGSLVQLSNASIGRVVENHPEAPLRPRIELFIDHLGSRVEGQEMVNLLMRRNLFIVKALDPRLIGAARRE